MDIKRKASLFAIVSASILALSKFATGLISGSMAVASSGLDSLLDAIMSGMNFFAIKKAAEPADKEHQYGHGKVADIAAHMRTLKVLGVPYTDEQIANAETDLLAQTKPDDPAAAALQARYLKAVVRDFDGDATRVSEGDALIAYLQMLGTLIDFKLYDNKTNLR